MTPLLRDLLEHQLWADAESWRAIEAHAAASDDGAIRTRLHHIHLVQRYFVSVVTPHADTAPSTTEKLESFDALRSYARRAHEGIRGCLALHDHQLNRAVDIPWFENPPLNITAAEALTQMAMHSHWHRGQNATRLRELGGEPPMADLIIWIWKGRPSRAL